MPWRLGGIEWTIVLGSVVALRGTFAGVQAVAMSGAPTAAAGSRGTGRRRPRLTPDEGMPVRWS